MVTALARLFDESVEGEAFLSVRRPRVLGSTSGAWRPRPGHLVAAPLLLAAPLLGLAAWARRRMAAVAVPGGSAIAAPCSFRDGSRALSEGDPCSILELTERDATWEVVFHGSVNVREIKDLSSEIIGLKWKCAQVVGRRDGDWVKLLHEPGYIIRSIGGIELLRSSPSYEKISPGTCQDSGSHPIMDVDTCKAAAVALGLLNTTVEQMQGDADCPEGCFLQDGKRLRLAAGASSVGAGAQGRCEAICSSSRGTAEPCHPFVTTTVTTTSPPTTVTTSTTWGWPSLFCFTVAHIPGPEVSLVKLQLRLRMGIFACNEFTAFSLNGDLTLGGDWTLARIQVPDAGKAANAWKNVDVFLKAWQFVTGDPRHRRHDWVVKADPDTVFFPSRLRRHLSSHTTKEGSNIFFLNCKLGANPKLMGSLEVFSTEAIHVYATQGWKCQETDWRNMGEDAFMQQCMMSLGSYPVVDGNMLADKRCNATPCSDKSKVAFHGFRDVKSYTACLRRSQR
mmetsp:Transcript_16280/g.50971  ORF Transcript_16280/g.50971 Transcript_16280/m.50971 type:complete len:507 (-) Transcript_16280:169-1689(-)